jgi:uroporphyrin-III C-methyltransferase/precorrin-2 dehydrogenase/sirohydrochlorin ferrochelatase
LRPTIKARIDNPARRRKFWEDFFDGTVAADVLAGRSVDVEEIASTLRTGEQGSGEVVLVGAGPGDPGLLTLRALRALQNADVILYDRLVSVEILDLARRDAERINVGKTAGGAQVSQDEINTLLVRLAQEGKRVCRLKGGDPFIFGRGGEELEALAAAGVRFEVVPGVTAAAGCAAYAGIPLTHRDHAQSLVFVTGHTKDGAGETVDWDHLARPAQTVVFYMGLGHLERNISQLRAHGAPESRSAAIVEQGTRAEQRVVTGTLADLAQKARQAGIQSPALLIVGEVTRLHATLQWFNAAAANPVSKQVRLTA